MLRSARRAAQWTRRQKVPAGAGRLNAVDRRKDASTRLGGRRRGVDPAARRDGPWTIVAPGRAGVDLQRGTASPATARRVGGRRRRDRALLGRFELVRQAENADVAPRCAPSRSPDAERGIAVGDDGTIRVTARRQDTGPGRRRFRRASATSRAWRPASSPTASTRGRSARAARSSPSGTAGDVGAGARPARGHRDAARGRLRQATAWHRRRRRRDALVRDHEGTWRLDAALETRSSSRSWQHGGEPSPVGFGGPSRWATAGARDRLRGRRRREIATDRAERWRSRPATSTSMGVRCDNEPARHLQRRSPAAADLEDLPAGRATYGVFCSVAGAAPHGVRARGAARGRARRAGHRHAHADGLAGARRSTARRRHAELRRRRRHHPAAPARRRLRARAVPGAGARASASVAANGGYRRLENQLYRVEIHAASRRRRAAATYTWSRDNGSVIARLVAFDAEKKAVTIEAPDRDTALSITADDYIEVTDERRSLRGERGLVLEVKSCAATSSSSSPLSRGRRRGRVVHGRLPAASRRPPLGGRRPVRPGKWTALEDGVEVEFAGRASGPASTGRSRHGR